MFWKRRSSLVLLSLTSLSSLSLAAVAQKIGPSPYLSFADSPFAATNFSSGYFYLENFESGILQTPGVTATGGSVYGPAFNADSVDADDGVIDGAGTNGHAYLGDGVTGIHFNFSASTLGALPTHVGIVWTDGSTFNDVTFEAFDASNNSLGAIVGNNLGDGNFNGGTAEDRFFGLISSQGISSIFITSPPSAGGQGSGIEVDHLQYGVLDTPAVPEPTSLFTFGMGIVGAGGLVRRRRRIAHF